MPGVPMKFSETPATVGGAAPRLGEHNDEVYGKTLRLSKRTLAAYKSEGVI